MSRTRALLRLAWRDAVRARGRSALTVVLIALPVLGVTIASVLLNTAQVSAAESLERRLGSADALVTPTGSGQVFQLPDPDAGSYYDGGSRRQGPDDVRSRLGDVQLTRLGLDRRTVVQGDRRLPVMVQGVDLQDPAAAGLFRLEEGAWPRGPGEVVINAALAGRGYGIGDEIALGADTVEVVGLAESAQERTAYVAAGDLPGTSLTGWLVSGREVDWATVGRLNAAGYLVLSRTVVLDPPDSSTLPPQVRDYTESVWQAYLAVVVLIVVMALIEVVLLAGPAFAVQARRQSRSLALMAATGATPAHLRRVVLSSGVVLGGLSALTGTVLGLVVGRLLVPVLQRWSDTWLGPFEVVPWQIAVIGAFGLVSAILAAVVPAWIAARQDVVAVLAGRRGDTRTSLMSPILGLLLLGAGIAGAAWGGTTGGETGVYAIAGSAIVSVLGMILLVPLVTVLVSRAAARLPLPLRFAARDAARHRPRTVPAVAAVAATVAGVVALGVANASDTAASEAAYTPELTVGWGTVAVDAARLDATRRVLEQAGVSPEQSRGLSWWDGRSTSETQVRWRGSMGVPRSYHGLSGTSDLVADRVPGAFRLSHDERATADEALAAGRVVVFVDDDLPPADGRLRVVDEQGEGGWHPVSLTFIDGHQAAPAASIVPTAVAEQVGEARPVGFSFRNTLDGHAEQRLEESLAGLDASLYAEHGFQRDQATLLAFWVLGAVGALLMLGGTLTATFLALSDARPDLATMSAVGAVPRTRRAVAASYALVVGLVGALLGAGVGLIPGIAVTYPLTGNRWSPVDANGAALPDHFLEIPWPLIAGLVVALPLLTALVVGLTARSRLPLVARLD